MPRRITIIIHSLSGGGAERIAATMADAWVRRGNEVTLITLDTAQSDRYRLDPGVHRVALGVMGESTNFLQALWSNRKRIRALRDAILQSRPDKVVSLADKTNVLALLACKTIDVELYIYEQVDPRRHSIGRVWSWLRRRMYPRCAALVILSERSRDFCRRLVRDKPVYVIPNAVAASDKKADQADPSKREELHILGMGRLTPQKGFDLLIEAFSRIADQHPRWKLKILGEGPQRAELKQLIQAKQLQEQVELLGWVDDPSSLLCRGDLFVLSSRYEGVPLALLEAMSYGLPVISFDCETGPAEIIRPGIDGLLMKAEDVEALTEAMQRLMSDDEARRELAKRAPEVQQRFGVDLFLRRWEAVFDGADAQQFANIQ